MSHTRHGLVFYYLPKLEMTITGNCAKRSFQDHDFDFLDGNYRRIYEITTALGPEALTAKQLASKVVSGRETMHQAFAVPLCVNDMVNITCVHCVFRYPWSFIESSPWDNKLFGIVGDITANQIPLVHIDPELFAVAGLVYAPTLPTIVKALVNWEKHSDGNGQFMGPISNAAGNPLYGQYTNLTTVQNIVYLPPCYAAMLVSQQIQAAQAWHKIGGAIVWK